MAFLRDRWRLLALMAATALVIVAPQLAIYYQATGRPLVSSYGALGFTFASPHLFGVLFSVQKGLFFWSPLLLLAFAGLPMLRGSARAFLLPAAVIFALDTLLDRELVGLAVRRQLRPSRIRGSLPRIGPRPRRLLRVERQDTCPSGWGLGRDAAPRPAVHACRCSSTGTASCPPAMSPGTSTAPSSSGCNDQKPCPADRDEPARDRRARVSARSRLADPHRVRVQRVGDRVRRHARIAGRAAMLRSSCDPMRRRSTSRSARQSPRRRTSRSR